MGISGPLHCLPTLIISTFVDRAGLMFRFYVVALSSSRGTVNYVRNSLILLLIVSRAASIPRANEHINRIQMLS